MWKERNRATATLIRSLSHSSDNLEMLAEYVVLESRNEKTGKLTRRSVYVTEQNGTRTLDLYSGWNPDGQNQKVPLKALPDGVCRLTSLERLWASHNKLFTLPPRLDQLVCLREVFLHRNNFEEIPQCLCKLPSLQLLWLNNNKITSIPADIGQLKSLKRLHLDYNFIKDFPASLCKLMELEVLYLNNNAIHSIHESVGDLTKLKRLYLNHNKITELPSGITKLGGIQLLLLDHNEIRSVRREFSIYQTNIEAEGKVVSLKNNPFFTPQSKLKLSLAGIGGSGGSSQKVPVRIRRLSDQREHSNTVRRPMRVSLPATSNMDQGFGKSSTLPRSVRLSAEPSAAGRQQELRANTVPVISTVPPLETVPILGQSGEPFPPKQEHLASGVNHLSISNT